MSRADVLSGSDEGWRSEQESLPRARRPGMGSTVIPSNRADVVLRQSSLFLREAEAPTMCRAASEETTHGFARLGSRAARATSLVATAGTRIRPAWRSPP